MKEITVEDVVATLTQFDNCVADIERKYGIALPMEIKLILKEYEGQFVLVSTAEHCKILDLDEITNADHHLGLNCVQRMIVPLVDCKDNNFLFYNAIKYTYEMMNIVDCVSYGRYKSILDFFGSF